LKFWMICKCLRLNIMTTSTLSKLWRNANQNDQGAEVEVVKAAHPKTFLKK